MGNQGSAVASNALLHCRSKNSGTLGCHSLAQHAAVKITP